MCEGACAQYRDGVRRILCARFFIVFLDFRILEFRNEEKVQREDIQVR